MPSTPYVGIPPFRVKRPSLAPVDISGTTTAPGHMRRHELFHGLDDVGPERRRRAGRRREGAGEVDRGIGHDALEHRLDAVRRVVREHPAVDGGAGKLREGVVGVAAEESGRDAGGAQQRIVVRRHRQPAGCRRIAGPHQRPHVGRDRRAAGSRRSGSKYARVVSFRRTGKVNFSSFTRPSASR